MARTTKQFPVHIFIFILVLCGNTIAQSTFSSDPPANSTYEILVPSRPVVHGFGVTYLSSYFPDSSFKEAYELAIEDLTANLFTSVYLEDFKSVGRGQHYEYAITDTLDSSLVVKLDSLEFQGNAYFFIGVDSLQMANLQPLEVVRSLSADTWTDDLFTPYESNGFWVASGKEKLSRYNPYRSWAVSKLNALSRLSNVLHTKVQSSNKTLNSSYREITYITSKNLFANIVVLRRTIKDGFCHTLLAVHVNDITQLN